MGRITSTRLQRAGTNITRYGKVTAIEYAPPGTKYPDMHEIQIDGVWEDVGPGHFYLTYKEGLPPLCAAGIVRHEGFGNDGRPRLTLTGAGQRVGVTIREDGKKRPVEVLCWDMNGAAVLLGANPAPPPMPSGGSPAASAPAQATSAPAAAGQAPPAPGAAPAAAQAAPAQSAPQGAGTPEERARKKAEQKKKDRQVVAFRWAGLSDHAVLAMRVAHRAALDLLGLTLEDFEALPLVDKVRIVAEVVRPSADSLKITCDRIGLMAWPGLVNFIDGIALSAEDPMRTLRENLTGFKAPPVVPSPARPTPAPAPRPEPKPAPAMAAAGRVDLDAGPEDEDDDDLPF